MKHILIFLFAVFLLALLYVCKPGRDEENKVSSVSIALIPQPVRTDYSSGHFTLTENTGIFCPAMLEETATIAAKQLGLNQPVNTGRRRKGIFLAMDPSLHREGYHLKVSREKIEITGGSKAGIFYGLQTLHQLSGFEGLPAKVPCAAITDYPRFRWRGLMLDCSRTFQSLEYLKKTIDRIAYYKMNVLHLHITDDQGWRLEIKSRTELTEKGAKFHPEYNEPERHQGFYSQEEMRAIVRYAGSKGITIVPEIEMPGHSTAVLVCYPELSCTGKNVDKIFPFFKGPSVTPDILCAGNEGTFALIEDVLDEIVEVFPAEFIHIGGDEAPKVRWEKCTKCQKRIREEGLTNEKGLQSYFISRVEKYIHSKGRRLIGWSEIIEGGLAPHAAVMDWIGGAKEATAKGQDVVMSPTSHCYFDYPYTSINSERAYGFDPVKDLSPGQSEHILGLQANFWSHIDREPELVDKQLFPRLLSIAERGWSPSECTDWDSFRPRLEKHLAVWRQMGINYYKEDISESVR
ncbi:beta-N-acetylhexosaminidase [bacterium]|nr:beta-N-acetylhexosaminidase [bacterium]